MKTNIVVNSRRKKRLKEFIDDPHPVMDQYYDILEGASSQEDFESKMNELINEDPDFFDPYNQLVTVLFENGQDIKAWNLLKTGYERAVKRIADAEGNWPEQMPWSWLENRHVMRILDRYAYELWGKGGTDAALDIYRRLLRANPGDNQGARHSILALLLGLGREEWYEPFVITEGPMAGAGLKAMELEQWYIKNAEKYPEDFAWLSKYWDEELA